MHHLFLLHTLDILGSIFALICTFFYMRANPLAWPTSLIAVIADGVLFTWTGLYGDAALEIFYLGSVFYGWYFWLYGKSQHEASIQHIKLNHALILTTLGICSFFLIFYSLNHFTNSKVPFLDAITTVLSLIAQWLTCRKIIECWSIWFLVDVMYLGLYFYKDIPAHGILLFIYLIMAIMGYFHWKKLMRFATIKNTLNDANPQHV